MNFLTVLTTVAVILLFMFCGLFTVKIGKAKTEHAQSVSGLLMYICAPAMLISSFLNIEHTKEAIISVGIFFLVSLTLQFAFFLYSFFSYTRSLKTQSTEFSRSLLSWVTSAFSGFRS